MSATWLKFSFYKKKVIIDQIIEIINECTMTYDEQEEIVSEVYRKLKINPKPVKRSRQTEIEHSIVGNISKNLKEVFTKYLFLI